MIGVLTNDQIDELLQSSVIGRIGCHSKGCTYVVPISYAYDGQCVYGHTTEGMKVDMMRSNPSICFEVDDISDLSHWRIVIAWGRYEELPHGHARTKALEVLVKRHLPYITSATTHLGATWPFLSDNIGDLPGIVFRIALKRKSGRFEKKDD